MIGRLPFSRDAQRIRDYSLSTRLPALLLGLMGLLIIADALFGEQLTSASRAWIKAPLFYSERGRVIGFLLGLGLLHLAGSLKRGKRTAWVLVMLALAVTSIYLLTRSPVQWIPALIGGLLMCWLLITRRSYTAASNPTVVRNGLRLWLQVMIGVIVLGTVGLAAAGSDQDWLISSLIVLAAAGAWGYLLLALDSPLPAPPPASTEDRRRALQIIEDHGRTSQAHLALLNDKRYFFTPNGSVIAYTVSGRVALTLGDPIGPEDDAFDAIAAFKDFCNECDWMAAFCLTSTDYLAFYKRLGLKNLCLGHEGIIHLPSFTLKGNANKTIRKRYNRLSAQGYRIQIYEPPISEDLLEELRLVSDGWLEMARAGEKRFFLAWFDEGYIRDERIAVVRSPAGIVCAFTNLVPEYQLNEISIDLMRRRQVESGTMDFLFVSLFHWAREQRYETFNLGLSPLYGVGEGSEPSFLERTIRYLYHHGNFYDFKGLNGFKIKFHPTWTPQYLVYPGLLSLGMIGLAMARVNAGENETLWDYFCTRPKHIEHIDTNDLSLLLSEAQGEESG